MTKHRTKTEGMKNPEAPKQDDANVQDTKQAKEQPVFIGMQMEPGEAFSMSLPMTAEQARGIMQTYAASGEITSVRGRVKTVTQPYGVGVFVMVDGMSYEEAQKSKASDHSEGGADGGKAEATAAD